MTENLDPRNTVGHRFTREGTHVDIVNSDAADVIDVVVADHAAPRVEERMRRMNMVKAPGGTQALRRTVNYRLKIENGEVTTISVPRPLGALILKIAAYVSDSRDPQRHLYDAAVLLVCIDHPIAERESFAGSDRSRLLLLQRELAEGHHAWLRMPAGDARRGQAVLRVLSSAP